MKLSAVLSAGLCVGLMAVAASKTARAQGSTAVFSSDVSVVMVPVFVVDRDGNAVRGLSAGDFEVEEDGKPVEVVSFRYVDTTDPAEQDELRLASPARRRFLLLFDKSFTVPSGLNRAQRGAIEFVRNRLAPSDLAAVATFDVNRGVRLVANFTEDRHLLTHAIRTLGVPSLARISDPLALAADLSITDLSLAGRTESADAPDGSVASLLTVLARRMRAADDQAYRVQVQTLMNGLGDLGRALRGVEGRKQVLFFSAGFDARALTGESGVDQLQASESIIHGRIWEVDDLGRFGDPRALNRVQEVTRALAGADAVVHSIDVSGLATEGSLAQLGAPADSQRSVPGRESLGVIASDTGGRFFRDANDLGPVLDEMERMTSRYYVLGFQPLKEKGPGAYHKIEIDVRRKGAKLSHRPGYYEKQPLAAQGGLQRQFEAAQLVMTGTGETDLPFSALCVPLPGARGRPAVALVLQVRKEALPWSSGKTLTLEAYGYGVAEDGTVHDHFAQLARVDPAQADPGGAASGISLFGTLEVPPGRHTVKLMLHERESGVSGTQFLEVTVPPHDPRRGYLLPPLVMDEPQQWLAMEIRRSSETGPASAFVVDGQPFVPRADSMFRPGEARKMALIAYEPRVGPDDAPDVHIRSSLTDGEGRQVPAGFLRVHKVHRDGNGRHTYVLGYTPEVVQAGDYTLRIGLGDGASRLEAYSLIRLRPGS